MPVTVAEMRARGQVRGSVCRDVAPLRGACLRSTPQMESLRVRPGLVKIRNAPLIQRRQVALVSVSAGRWGEIVGAADVVSEGRTEIEGDRLVYYGSTSVI